MQHQKHSWISDLEYIETLNSYLLFDWFIYAFKDILRPVCFVHRGWWTRAVEPTSLTNQAQHKSLIHIWHYMHHSFNTVIIHITHFEWKAVTMLFILRERRAVIVYYNILFVLLEKYLCLNQNQVHQALPSVFIDKNNIFWTFIHYITIIVYIYTLNMYIYIYMHTYFIYFIYIVLDIKKVHSAQHAFLVANMR